MAFLDDLQLKKLTIERMIFHVVGPKEEHLVLLNEVAPGEHSDFFLDRIRSTNKGLMFDFIDGSSLAASLNKIKDDANTFAEQSKILAKLFHSGHVGSASLGAFLVFILRCDDEDLYALIKYDHETVLSYTINGADALMSALHDTFVKSPEALQKSAIIRLTDDGGELAVRDRSSPTKTSKYFQTFLGAKRRFNSTTLTVKLCEITKRVALSNSVLLGPVIIRGISQRIFDYIQQASSFDPANREPFLAGIFGALPEDSKVRMDFEKALSNERIQSETFDFDRGAVTKPQKTRLTTIEGIQVIYDKQFSNRVTRETNGTITKIIIESGGVKDEDDYTEPSTGRR
jgi:hypothetical protein